MYKHVQMYKTCHIFLVNPLTRLWGRGGSVRGLRLYTLHFTYRKYHFHRRSLRSLRSLYTSSTRSNTFTGGHFGLRSRVTSVTVTSQFHKEAAASEQPRRCSSLFVQLLQQQSRRHASHRPDDPRQVRRPLRGRSNQGGQKWALGGPQGAKNELYWTLGLNQSGLP